MNYDENQLPEPGHFRKFFWLFLVSGALFVAGVVVYILFFYNQPEKPSYEGEVKVSMSAPEEIPSGSEISYEILIDNRSNSKLISLNLEAFYPRGFSFLDATPDPVQNNPRLFSLPDLPIGRKQRLVIVGKQEGAVQEIKTASVKLHYVPEDFRSNFVAEASASTVILSPNISLELVAPPQVVTGQNLLYEVHLTPVANEVFSNLVLRLTYPKEFVPDLATSPTTTKESLVEWMILALEPGKSETRALNGRVVGEAGKEIFAEVELLSKDQEGSLTLAGNAFAFTVIEAAPLSLRQVLETSEEKFEPGQEVKYSIEYENVSEIPLQNVTMALVFETPEVFDLSRILSQTGQVVGQKLLFVPARVPGFLNLVPGASGKLSFTVPISSSLVERLIKNPHLLTRVEFTSQEIAEPLSGNILDYKISSKAGLEASVRQAGSGTYRVEFAVTNTVNDLSGAEVKGVIPEASVVFDAATINPAEERDKVRFNQVTGEFTWQLGKVFAFSGQFHQPRTLSFDLHFPPGQEPGQYAVILRGLELSGTDEYTGREIATPGQDLTLR